eukprot:223584-Pleurochrysis_carterae.AAC.1
MAWALRVLYRHPWKRPLARRRSTYPDSRHVSGRYRGPVVASFAAEKMIHTGRLKGLPSSRLAVDFQCESSIASGVPNGPGKTMLNGRRLISSAEKAEACERRAHELTRSRYGRRVHAELAKPRRFLSSSHRADTPMAVRSDLHTLERHVTHCMESCRKTASRISGGREMRDGGSSSSSNSHSITSSASTLGTSSDAAATRSCAPSSSTASSLTASALPARPAAPGRSALLLQFC